MLSFAQDPSLPDAEAQLVFESRRPSFAVARKEPYECLARAKSITTPHVCKNVCVRVCVQRKRERVSERVCERESILGCGHKRALRVPCKSQDRNHTNVCKNVFVYFHAKTHARRDEHTHTHTHTHTRVTYPLHRKHPTPAVGQNMHKHTHTNANTHIPTLCTGKHPTPAVSPSPE